MSSYAQKLAAMLQAPAQPAQTPPQLGGMAGGAQQAIAGRAYQLHQQEAKANGQTPLTPEQFAAQQRGQ